MPEKRELSSKILSMKPDPAILARLDALADHATEVTGITVRRGGVAVAALEAGIEVLEERAKPRKRARTVPS